MKSLHLVNTATEAQHDMIDEEQLVDAPLADLAARVAAVVAVAEASAAAVDKQARFPQEAFDEIRRQRLLGLFVPERLGGEGVPLAKIVDICFSLGQACSSTALIYAMHQVKIGCIVRHNQGSVALEKLIRRVAEEQLLLASSTTEGSSGGNVRSSDAPIGRIDDRITLERKATVISYAWEADGIVTTARRSVEAAASDQVLVVLLKADYSLERLGAWDTLGMRGTHSEGFALRAQAAAAQVLPDRYDKIHAHTMVPFAHLCWGAVWAGIAAAATAQAQAFIRHSVRQSDGQLPPGVGQFTQAVSSLRLLRGLLSASLKNYEAVMNDDAAVASLEFQSTITLTKVQASELAVSTVASALRACGLSGYRNDGEFTIGRHLRDVLSAPLMINNERMLSNLTMVSLMTPLPTAISS